MMEVRVRKRKRLPRLDVSKLPLRFQAADSLQDLADLVTVTWRRSVDAIVSVGLHLCFAKRVVSHGDWGRLFKGHPLAVDRPIPISQHMAELLMRIARHRTLSNSTHGSNLPSSWRTLAELARLPPEAVEVLLAKGRIHPKTTRAEVCAWHARLRALESSQPAARVKEP